ncbi:hypothetical protein BGZ90_005985, partial [Linnemannia elongata]
CHQDRNILLLGLDASGKTSLFNRLHLNTFGQVISTIGFHVQTICQPFSKEHLVLWDVSGQSIPLWRHYLPHKEALVFVVDSTDYARIGVAKEALWGVLQNDDMAETGLLLVYANKQDQSNAMTVREVMEALDIENLVRNTRAVTRVGGAVVIIGTANGGKTTLLYRLHLGEVVTTIPTVGFNVEYLTIMGIEFIIWDVAGTWGNRSLWHQIAQGAAGVICVIDSTDLDQIEEAKGHLWRMFEHYDVQEKECPLLVFANKQDRLGALSVAEVKDKLELETRSQGRRWHIRGSIATTGDGLMGGMEWMATQLKGTSKK